MNKRQLLALVFIICLILLLPFLLFLVQKRQDIRPRALQGKANLLMSSDKNSASVGESINVLVAMQLLGSGLQVSGIDFMILYDKDKLDVINIVPALQSTITGGIFTEAPIVTSGGKFDDTYNFLRVVELAKMPNSNLPIGSVILANITFRSIGEGSAVVKFPEDNKYIEIVGTGIYTGLTTIDSFVYQLQKINYDVLYSTDYNLVVTDWQEANLSSEQLNNLKKQGKRVVSYLSIGEAENYRSYWQADWREGNPDFIEKENPDWKGNYKVKYWDNRWQDIIFQQLDSIIDKGYDGVYMDIIDAYYYFSENGRTTAKQEMIDFVRNISSRAKAKKSGFLIIPQNSPEIIEDQSYVDAIDGLGKEDTWYLDDNLRDEAQINSEIVYLDQAIQKSKFVLVIDYPTNHEKQCDFIHKAREHHFVPFVSNRALDKVEVIKCS